MNENMNNRDMKQLQDEYEAEIEKLKEKIRSLEADIAELEHLAGVYIEAIDKLNNIALEG